jgi:hypothetical protein
MNRIINKIKLKIKNINWEKLKKDFPEIITKDYILENPFPSITKYYLTKDRS